MMKGGVDVTVTELDKAHPFKIFADYNFYFGMRVINEHYSFTFSSVITVWLHDNVSPIINGRWIINSLSGIGGSIEIYFKEEKDAAFFKLTWVGSQ